MLKHVLDTLDLLDDPSVTDRAAVQQVVFCSGKVAYDLLRRRDEKKAWDVAIVRVEQLYPGPHKAVAADRQRYPTAPDGIRRPAEP